MIKNLYPVSKVFWEVDKMNCKNAMILLLILTICLSFGDLLTFNNVVFNWDYDIVPYDYDVAKVIGHLYADTIRVDLDGKVETITLLGVLTPDNPNSKSHYAYFSSNAAEFTKQLCPYQSTVYLSYDQTEKDKYNRRLAYLWYKVNGQWIMHNLNLLANGYGIVSDSYFVREDLQEHFHQAQEQAQNETLGLWKKEAARSNIEIVMSSSSDMVRISTVKYSGKPLYIEIKNVGSAEKNLNRWFLYSISSKRVFSFGQIVIQPFETIKVYFGPDRTGSLFWEGDHLLNSDGDGVILYNEKGKQVSIYSWGY